MKKALSLFLAVLMIFAAMSVSVSAVDVESPWHSETGKPASYEQAVLKFVLDGGSLKSGATVYDLKEGKYYYEENVTDIYVMVPLDGNSMKPGYHVTLPQVTAPAGYQFDGWYCYDDHQAYSATWGGYVIPENGAGRVIEFRAAYSPSTPEEDTFAKVMGILIKIFGSIIGLVLFQDMEAGQAMLEELFSGLVF